MLNEYINNAISDKLKNIIKSSLEPSYSILAYANVRLYIAYEDTEFENTNLDGFMCLIINRKHSCLYLHLYEYHTYKKEFEIELYTNIEKGYMVLNDYFHSIEYPGFFLGINFANKLNAEKMKNTIMYNSLILNSQTNQFSITNSKKLETDNQRNPNIVNEINSLFKNKEREIFENADISKYVNFHINREENNIVFDIKKDEFEKSLYSFGLYWANYESHYKKIKGSVLKLDENVTNSMKNLMKNEEKKFVEYDAHKKKSILSVNLNKNLIIGEYDDQYKKSAISNNNVDDKRQSLRHAVHMQVYMNF
jgi:hypothetical protein